MIKVCFYYVRPNTGKVFEAIVKRVVHSSQVPEDPKVRYLYDRDVETEVDVLDLIDEGYRFEKNTVGKYLIMGDGGRRDDEHSFGEVIDSNGGYFGVF
ncbi:MAG TPA: hypothetical protein VJA22_01870 [Patescibacteria group bacterium]|nr:hypothetical protein [Patescibacteria group bacterium]